ncbi:MAG: hypothetical protein ABSH38_18235, partial [Verrucomicrobiota bacterium]
MPSRTCGKHAVWVRSKLVQLPIFDFQSVVFGKLGACSGMSGLVRPRGGEISGFFARVPWNGAMCTG